MHAINAYNNLHQGSNESASAYLQRAQDILECIYNTCDMTSIPAIGTNHAKILTVLQDKRLCNKLAESKVKNGLPCLKSTGHSRYGHWLWNDTWVLTSNIQSPNTFHPQILVPLSGVTSHLQEMCKNHQTNRKNPSVGTAKETTIKMTAQQPPNQVPLKIQVNQRKYNVI